MEVKGREKQIIDERIKKISELRKEGVNPYSHRFDEFTKKEFADDLQKKYEKLKNEEETKDEVVVAGRLMSKRSFGKISFGSLQDRSGFIQVVLQEGRTSKEAIDFFKKIDSGDIIGVIGKIFRTQRGEISVAVSKIDLLTKSVLPLPEKWHGLKDEDEKLRKRYLDILMNPDVKEIFFKKQKFWQTIRNFLIERGFLEVETPVLENSAGGASATPFITHHNALDIDIYLRISMGELWQKKLLVAGYEKTFEIGRQFRNEGMDMEHLQDYSQMEFYWAYADYKDGMKLIEQMYKEVAKVVIGTLKFKTHGYEVDLSKKWEVYDYEKLIKEKTGLDIYEVSDKEARKFLDKQKIIYDKKAGKWRLVDLLWKFCRKQIAGPGFLVGQPVEISPLAKRSREDLRKVEQFQIIIAGTELGNGYSELNDPFDQEERFKEQRKLKEAGDTEAQEHDESFVEALKYGMPPACGFGVSERFFSYLADRPIRECIAFPLMKPENSNED
ncbi:MAG: lysine--tRNA ligase [Nanoarchaeota archaeon]|nr:lysine--tRNA ligase [Nanoarchaeota archaeon]